MKKDSWTLFPFLSHFTYLTLASKLSALWLQHVYQSSIHCWWNERRFSRWLDVVWWRRGGGDGGGGVQVDFPSRMFEWVRPSSPVSSGSYWRRHLSLAFSMGTFLEEWRNSGMKTAFSIAPNYYPYLRLLPIITQNSIIPSHSLL